MSELRPSCNPDLAKFDSYLKIMFKRYRRKRPKVDASIFDSALSHTRRSDAAEKREENCVSTFGRFRLWTNFESSPVSIKKRIFLDLKFSSLNFNKYF